MLLKLNEPIPSTEMAKILGLTRQGLARLNRSDVLPKVARGQYEIAATVQRYVAYREQMTAEQTASPADIRFREARAREIELRIAREDRRLIDLSEAMGIFDQLTGSFLTELSSYPARLAGTNREARVRVENLIDASRERLSRRFASLATELETGEEMEIQS